jgi:hypothetical protein
MPATTGFSAWTPAFAGVTNTEVQPVKTSNAIPPRQGGGKT